MSDNRHRIVFALDNQFVWLQGGSMMKNIVAVDGSVYIGKTHLGSDLWHGLPGYIGALVDVRLYGRSACASRRL